MENDVVHYNQYKHNKNFISYGISNNKDEKFYDWEITAYFYAAVHLVEAVMYKKFKNVNIRSHEDRKLLIKSNQETFGESERSYSRLYHLSRTSRYEGITNVTYYDAYKAQEYLEDIEQSLLKYIKD